MSYEYVEQQQVYQGQPVYQQFQNQPQGNVVYRTSYSNQQQYEPQEVQYYQSEPVYVDQQGYDVNQVNYNQPPPVPRHQNYQGNGNAQRANAPSPQLKPQNPPQQRPPRSQSTGPQTPGYTFYADPNGNYQPTSDPPLFTTGEPSGVEYVSYSSYPRRAKSVDVNEPAAGAGEIGYKFGGMDFIDHVDGDIGNDSETVDLNSKAPKTPIRRDGDNYGLDFNESVYRGENVEVEQDYQGYQAQKPRKHWNYCEDPFNPNNAYVEGLLAGYDPQDMVGDTIANHRVSVDRQLMERSTFCTEYVPTPGFLPHHRTEKPEPKEPGPICYSLSAKKELAHAIGYVPPERSQSVGPAVSNNYPRKDVNLRTLVDGSATERQPNVIQPAPWAPESDYKTGRWQSSGSQLEPLNHRPQIPKHVPLWVPFALTKYERWYSILEPLHRRPTITNNQPEWSQQVQEKRNVYSSPNQRPAQPSKPVYWDKHQQQAQNRAPVRTQNPNEVSTNYTYYNGQPQQGQQVQQRPAQPPQNNVVSYTVQQQNVQQQQPQQKLQQQPQQQQQQQQQRQPPQQQNQQQVQFRQGVQQRPQPQQQGGAQRPHQGQLVQNQQQRQAVPQQQNQQQQQLRLQQNVPQQRPGTQPQAQQVQSQQIQRRTQSQPPVQRGVPQQNIENVNVPQNQSQVPQPDGQVYQQRVTYVNGQPVQYQQGVAPQQQQQQQQQQQIRYNQGQQQGYYSQQAPSRGPAAGQQVRPQQAQYQQRTVVEQQQQRVQAPRVAPKPAQQQPVQQQYQQQQYQRVVAQPVPQHNAQYAYQQQPYDPGYGNQSTTYYQYSNAGPQTRQPGVHYHVQESTYIQNPANGYAHN